MDSLFLKFIKALSIWAIIQVWPSLMCFKLPERLLDEDHWLYRTKNWERDGRIYEKFFKVRKWKHRIPDAGSFFKFGFPKKTLKSSSKKYLKKFLLEMNRAEWMHLMAILHAPIFFFSNLWWIGTIMTFNVLAVNLPCVILQRYNRPRILKTLKRLKDIDFQN